MNIAKNVFGEEVVFSVDGKVDAVTSAELGKILLAHIENDNKQATIDFTNVSYISSAGLRVLINAQKLAAGKGWELTLTGLSPQVKEIFRMTGLLDTFGIK